MGERLQFQVEAGAGGRRGRGKCRTNPMEGDPRTPDVWELPEKSRRVLLEGSRSFTSWGYKKGVGKRWHLAKARKGKGQ